MTLTELLAAREARVQRQRELLHTYGKPLVSFTMNIPGPVKNNELITAGFLLGSQWLTAQFPSILYKEERLLPTGCEGFYVIEGKGQEIKALCIQLEERQPIGRLFDLDVLLPTGEKLQRPHPRSCLLCGEDARICARCRRHSLQALEAETVKLLTAATEQAEAEKLGALAVQSLLYELCTTPKPGLVDMNNNGCHKDMDAFTFCASAAALSDYFRFCALLGIQSRGKDPQSLLPLLRCEGRLAEERMYLATKGINTHKGAIFSLGLMTAAAGRIGKPYNGEAICGECSRICKDLVKKDLASLSREEAKSKGEQLYLRYGTAGARAQAEAGFPTVLHVGLPVLQKGLSQGYDRSRSAAAALLAMLCEETDTCLLSRSSPEALRLLQGELRELLSQEPYPDAQILSSLDRRFTAENLSPGGMADLLSLCFFLQDLSPSAPNKRAETVTEL